MARRRPPFVRSVRDAHPDKTAEVWFEDEARIGQQGTLTTVWAERGSRPSAVKQTEYQWEYISDAVNPLTGVALGVITEEMNTSVMNDLLGNLAAMVGEDRHAVLVWDGAGFHTAGRLAEIPVPGVSVLHAVAMDDGLVMLADHNALLLLSMDSGRVYRWSMPGTENGWTRLLVDRSSGTWLTWETGSRSLVRWKPPTAASLSERGEAGGGG